MLSTVFGEAHEMWEQHRLIVHAVQDAIRMTHQRNNGGAKAHRSAYISPKEIPELDHIVQIDPDRSTVWVEPNVTMMKLVQATLELGRVPAIVDSSRSVSVADAFSETTTASSSFVFGTFDCTVMSLEGILSNGDFALSASNDKNGADLLFGSAGAMHTLCLMTLLEIVLVPASGYVELTFLPVSSFMEARHKMRPVDQSQAAQVASEVDSCTDFLEGVMFSPFAGVVLTGRFVSSTSLTSTCQPLICNDFTEGLRSVLREVQCCHKVRTLVLPTVKYLFRFDPMRTRKMKRLRLIKKAHPMALEDVGLPGESVDEYIRQFHGTKDSWPIRMYPVVSPNVFGRLSFGVGANFESRFWNLKFPRSRLKHEGVMERWIRDAQGFRFLHCRAHCMEETAWVFHDDRWYCHLRSRWEAQGFPGIAEKLRSFPPS